ncbi:flavin reductase family protein [bacterium]|nr:MAG: flavin reductase family protein [bacterium]
MNFSISELGPRDAYKLLTGVVVPRPIALVTSIGSEGVLNAAPFSFFNLVGSNPPIVALSVTNRPSDAPKDSARNIRERHEFVVNMVSKEMMDVMNTCAVDFPEHLSEVEAAGLETVPSTIVKVPRLKISPAALECREHTTLYIGENRLIIGEVVALYIADEYVDLERKYVDSNGLDLVGRMGGGGGYTDTSGTFELSRLSFAEWQEKNGEALG